jgi:oxygen-independent coproporphyrinogen-3 oxidase
VTWLAKQQRGFERRDLPSAPARLRIFLLAIRRFLDAGYRFIGLDHFALPDDELCRALDERTLRRNFMGHTTQAGVDLIGFGPSAISELRGYRSFRSSGGSAVAGAAGDLRGLPHADDRAAWAWALVHGELRAEEFEATFGERFASRFAPELEQLAPLADDGLVERARDGSLALTPLGRLLVRNVAMVFDAYLRSEGAAHLQPEV